MKSKAKLLVISVLTLLMITGLCLSSCSPTVQAAKLPDELVAKAFMPAAVSDDIIIAVGPLYFAKYDGFDGESDDANHTNWVEFQSIEWGAHQPVSGVSGTARRRADVDIDELVITMPYEKACIKLQEKCLKGQVIPKLEIELTTAFETHATYLTYELKNVRITSFDFSADLETGPWPLLTVSHNFEEVKVTYTEFDDAGNSMGNVEFSYKVEAGR